MEEKMLLEWKEAHAEVYAKFKEDLEGQLQKPYHQTNLVSVSSEDGFDLDKLYTKAVESGDASVYCLCYYFLFDNGEDRLADAIADKVERPDAQEILDAVQEYRRFYKQNRKQEVAEITTDELNILTLRRWHYDHPEEYKEFTPCSLAISTTNKV